MISRKTLKEMQMVALQSLKQSNSIGGKIGAAVLGSSGRIYGGCCLMSIPQDMCAERVALYKAVSEGERKIMAVLISRKKSVGGKGSPCGHCLQDLWNLSANPQLRIYSWHGDKKEPSKPKTIKQCYPYPYSPQGVKK